MLPPPSWPVPVPEVKSCHSSEGLNLHEVSVYRQKLAKKISCFQATSYMTFEIRTIKPQRPLTKQDTWGSAWMWALLSAIGQWGVLGDWGRAYRALPVTDVIHNHKTTADN